MARVNIEDDLFKDQRFIDLVIALKDYDTALGAVARCWSVAQSYWKQSDNGIPKPEWLKQKLKQELIDSGLAEDRGDFVFVVGSEKHFAWIRQRVEAGESGGIQSGKSRAEIKGKKSKRKEAGASKRKQNEPSSSSSLSFSLSSSFSDSELNTVPAGASPDRPPLNSRIWDAYRDEYKYRYQVEPTRNATVNAQIAQLGKRLGEDAPEVVRFYIRHNKSYYVQSQHTTGPLLKDAESLCTQWQRGQAVLTTHGRDAERAQHNFDVFERAAENVDRRENSNVNG